MRFSTRILVCIGALVASAPVYAWTPPSRIIMTVAAGKSSMILYPKSVAFSHAALVVHLHVKGSKPPKPTEFTVKFAASTVPKGALKLHSLYSKIDMALFGLDPAGRQHFRSQVELGDAVVEKVALSGDKRTTIIVLSSKRAALSEQTPTNTADWVTARSNGSK